VGWHLLKLYNFKYGKDAIKVKKAVFKWIRKDLNIPVFLSDEQFSHVGSSETFSDISIPAEGICNKLNNLTKGYRNNP
jgi:hypothetical protein